MKCLNIALFLVYLISAGSSTAKSAELKDVQVSVDVEEGLTRIVFVFNEETRGILDTQSGDRIIYVHFPQADKSSNFENPTIPPAEPSLDRIEISAGTGGTTAKLYFDRKLLSKKASRLNNPFRYVLNLYWQESSKPPESKEPDTDPDLKNNLRSEMMKWVWIIIFFTAVFLVSIIYFFYRLKMRYQQKPPSDPFNKRLHTSMEIIKEKQYYLYGGDKKTKTSAQESVSAESVTVETAAAGIDDKEAVLSDAEAVKPTSVEEIPTPVEKGLEEAAAADGGIAPEEISFIEVENKKPVEMPVTGDEKPPLNEASETQVEAVTKGTKPSLTSSIISKIEDIVYQAASSKISTPEETIHPEAEEKEAPSPAETAFVKPPARAEREGKVEPVVHEESQSPQLEGKTTPSDYTPHTETPPGKTSDSIITEKMKNDVIRRLRGGEDPAEIARHLGLTRMEINLILEVRDRKTKYLISEVKREHYRVEETADEEKSKSFSSKTYEAIIQFHREGNEPKIIAKNLHISTNEVLFAINIYQKEDKFS